MKTVKIVMPVGRRLYKKSNKAWSHTCGKFGYSSRKIAASAAARQRKESGENIVHYRCKRGCHCWHIGHPPGTKPT